MNYSAIKYNDIANGLGVRTSLFVSGCTHNCKGCFNKEAQDFNAGWLFDDKAKREILYSLTPTHIRGLSLLGGEPMEAQNQPELCSFLKEVRVNFPNKDIWIYSGFTFEELIDSKSRCFTEYTLEMLSYADVLVDGEFILDQKDISLVFKGSRNQRILNLKASLEQKKPIIYNFNERTD